MKLCKVTTTNRKKKIETKIVLNRTLSVCTQNFNNVYVLGSTWKLRVSNQKRKKKKISARQINKMYSSSCSAFILHTFFTHTFTYQTNHNRNANENRNAERETRKKQQHHHQQHQQYQKPTKTPFSRLIDFYEFSADFPRNVVIG